MFRRFGGIWVFQQKLQVPHSPSLGLLRFGFSVSLSADGRTALIGAQGSNPAVGGEDAAFVFTANLAGLFTLQQKLTNPAGGFSANQFGFSVSLSSNGKSALVGAPAPTSPSQGGAVYVFARGLVGGWTLQQRLGANSPTFDAFGTSVSQSTDGRTALIGAPATNSNGAAYVFARGLVGGFVRQQQLLAADGASGDAFGQAVTLSGDGVRAVVGAPDNDDGMSTDVGAAYVFARGFLGGFVQQQRLQPNDRAAGDDFGDAVSFDRGGTQVLIGAQGKDAERGAAYLFARGLVGGFTQRQRLQATVRVAGDFFGWSVAKSPNGNVSLVGAPEISGGPGRGGSAYVFTP